jgi:hypothetical protein
VRGSLFGRAAIIRKHDHQIAWSGPINSVTPNPHPFYAGAIPSNNPCRQNNAAHAASFTDGSFHRDTSIVKVSGKFHNQVRVANGKKSLRVFPAPLLYCVFTTDAISAFP